MRSRLEGESIMAFMAELRNLLKHCNFGGVLEDMLRDRLVCGVNNDKIQERLFAEASLSYSKAMEIAMALEAATRDVASVQSDVIKFRQGASGGQEASVNKVNKAGKSVNDVKKAENGNKNISAYKCFRCGYGHLANSCRHKDYRCFKCRKNGHLATMCRSEGENWKGGGKETWKKPVRGEVNTIECEEEDDVYVIQSMFKVGGVAKPPILIPLTINGKDLTMELDTGAAISIISKQCFDEHWGADKTIQVQPSRVRLKGYFGQLTEAVGEWVASVKFRKRNFTLPLCIAPGEGPSLLGRDWIGAMEVLPELFELHTVVGSGMTLEGVLDKFGRIFAEGLGKMKNAMAKISMPAGAKPRFFKSRQVPFATQDKVEKEIDRLVAEGVLVSVRYSEWAAPIVVVPKDDGSVRITGDFKITVNTVSNLEQYPVPRIDELFAKLSGGQKFTKLDLKDAYFQMELEELSQAYVTINTSKGLFRYTRLPFGLASAPAIFIRAMDGLLGDLKQVVTFFDDILITGKDDKEHLETLSVVLERLTSAGLKLKRPKCGFLQPEVVYLGYRLDKDGLHPIHEKVQAIKGAREPENIRELQAYLGLLNHYRRFMPNLSNILEPLHQLLRNETAWLWSKKESDAFTASKALLTSEDLLVFFDPSKPIVVSCDASPYGVGAVLSHRFPDGSERPVGFVSRSLSQAEKNYAQLDKEALALVFAVVKFHQYLYGFKFEMQTDHKPLLGLFREGKPIPFLSSPRIIRWAILLSAYDFRLMYKPGEKNCNADALSRLPMSEKPVSVPRPAEIFMLEKEYPDLLSAEILAKHTNRDPVLSRIRRYLWLGESIPVENPELQHFSRRQNELSVQENCVLWGSRVIVPQNLRNQVLNLLHEGHPGMIKMKSVARLHVWWPCLDRSIEEWVKSCGKCQSLAKSSLAVPMRSWPFPGRPWSRLHIDHAGPFHGKLFLIVVDAFSKWVEVLLVTSTSAQATIGCLRTVFLAQGIPDVVVSDNGSGFVSQEFRTFLKNNGISHIQVPPYHPASNGAAERVVQTVKDSLRKLGKGDVGTNLARFLLRYRSQIHATTGVSPAELLCNRKLKTLIDCMHPNLQEKVANKQLRSKLIHDTGCKEITFKGDDTVFVRNFREGPKWVPGMIQEIIGSTVVIVKVDKGLWKRHTDHVRHRWSNGGPASMSQGDEWRDPGRVPEVVQSTEGSILEDSTDGEVEVVERNQGTPIPACESGATETPTRASVTRKSGRLIKKPDKLNL